MDEAQREWSEVSAFSASLINPVLFTAHSLQNPSQGVASWPLHEWCLPLPSSNHLSPLIYQPAPSPACCLCSPSLDICNLHKQHPDTKGHTWANLCKQIIKSPTFLMDVFHCPFQHLPPPPSFKPPCTLIYIFSGIYPLWIEAQKIPLSLMSELTLTEIHIPSSYSQVSQVSIL